MPEGKQFTEKLRKEHRGFQQGCWLLQACAELEHRQEAGEERSGECSGTGEGEDTG